MDSLKVTDKAKMLDCFNEHFIASGFLFESFSPQHECSSTVETVSLDPPSLSFSFTPIKVSDVNKALKHLDTTKFAGPDKLDLIAMPLTTILNPCLNTKVIPLICDCDHTILNNYSPISADQF